MERRRFLWILGSAGAGWVARRAISQEKSYPVKYPIPKLDDSYIYYCPELLEITEPGPLILPDGTSRCSWSRKPYLDLNFEDAHFYPIKSFQQFRMKKWDMYHGNSSSLYFSFLIAWIGYAAFCSAYVYDRKNKQGFEDSHFRSAKPEPPMMRDSTMGITEYKSSKVHSRFEVKGERRRIQMDFPDFAGLGLFADLEFYLPSEHEMICATHLTNPRRMHYDVKINCMTITGELSLDGKKYQLQPQDSFGMLDFGRGFFPPKLFWYWAVASGRDQKGNLFGFNLGHGNSPHQTNENAIFYQGKLHKVGEIRCYVPQENLMKEWTIRSLDSKVELSFKPENLRYAHLKIGPLHSIGNPVLGFYNGKLKLDSGEIISVNNLFGLYEWFDQKW